MADKIVIEAEVKSNVGEVSKEAAQAASEFKVLGVSLNDVKGGFTTAGRTAKAMFGSIKAGLVSTGIGAFVLAIGSLVGYLTNTKKGSEQLEVALKGIGSAFNVIIDRISTFGGGLLSLLQGNKQGLLDMLNAFKGIGEEIENDTKATIALTRAQQRLTDSNRNLNVETAKQRAEVERLKLIAEDTTKTEEERLAAAQSAFTIENDLLDKRIANSEEALRLQREGMELRKVDGENTAADLDQEAQLQIDLFNIVQESTTKQIELNNKINSIKDQTAAKNQELRDKEKAAEDAAFEEMIKRNNEFNEEQERLYNEEQQRIANDIANQKKADAEKMQLEEDLATFKRDMAMQGLDLVKMAAGEGTVLAKAAAVAQATISGIQGVQNAFTAANANVALTAATAGADPIAQASAAGIFAAANIASIISGGKPSGNVSTGGGAAAAGTPAPQMMSGAFELGGGVAPEPIKAFVVTDEMTKSQAQLANIRRRATI